VKIINIIHFSAAYHLLKDDEPEVRWETRDGNWSGIWRGNWSHQIGDALIKTGQKIDYEVWRPDSRADKMYSHTFENGLVYKLFPVFPVKRFDIFKIREQLFSTELIKNLIDITRNEKVIIHLNSSPLIFINYSIIDKISHIPIVLTLHGNQNIYGSRIPVLNYFKRQNFIKKWKKVNSSVDFITYQNEAQKKFLADVGYRHDAELVTMGCDFDFWIPSKRPRSNNTKKFLMVCRFVPLKQVEKIIQVFLELKDYNDFLLTLVGNGDSQYTEYLKRLAEPLLKQNKAKFPGYLEDKALLQEYQNNDCFIMASTSEGCPVSVMQALACNLKVFSTRVGCTATLLEKNGAGMIVSPFDYNQWKKEFADILDGKPMKVLDREIARSWFDWKNVADKFMNIYNEVFTSH